MGRRFVGGRGPPPKLIVYDERRKGKGSLARCYFKERGKASEKR